MIDEMLIEDALVELRAAGYCNAKVWRSGASLASLVTIYLNEPSVTTKQIWSCRLGQTVRACDVWIAVFKLVANAAEKSAP